MEPVNLLANRLIEWMGESWRGEEGQARFYRASAEATRLAHMISIYADRERAKTIYKLIEAFVVTKKDAESGNYDVLQKAVRIKDELIESLSSLMHDAASGAALPRKRARCATRL